MKSKQVKISRDKDGKITLALGREQTTLTADNLVEISELCIQMRSHIKPSMVEDIVATGHGLSDNTGMKWRLVRNESKDGIEMQIGHPGFGWFAMHLSPEQSDNFLQQYMKLLNDPRQKAN